MKKGRIILLSVLILLASAISGFLAYSQPPKQIVAERNYIESHYESLLALIETRASEPVVEWRDKTDGQLPEELEEREFEIYKEIGAALPPQLVYWATWSSDGHHGLRGLHTHQGQMGYQTAPKPVTRSKDGLREMRRGQSVEGDELLVLRCHVPNGRKHYFTIAFYQKKIRQEMLSNTNKDVQPAAPPDGAKP